MHLSDEYLLYPKDRAKAYLEKKNAPASVIHKAAAASVSLVGGFNGCGVFTPEDGNFDVMLYPVTYNGEVFNVVAWEPQKPKKWYLRVCDDSILGMTNVYEARTFRKPLRVFDNPMEYIMAGEKGCCPLTTDACLELIGLEIECSDQMFKKIGDIRDEYYPLPKRVKT